MTQLNLDQLPLTVRTSRRKVWIGLAGSSAIAFAAWYFSDSFTWLFWLAGGTGLLCLLLGLMPPSLIISADGLLWSTMARDTFWPWSDFEEFYVDDRLLLGIVACNFAWTYPGGDRGVFFGLWETPAHELVPLLNAACRRWSRLPLAGPAPIE